MTIPELVNEIIDQEVESAKARRHRMADPAELSAFAETLAKYAPPGMTAHAMRWCYRQHRIKTSAKMTPAYLNQLWRQYRNGAAVPQTKPREQAQAAKPGRYAVIIAHRLFKAMGMAGNPDLAPLMPGDDEILSKPPCQEEANEFFAIAAPKVVSNWLANPNYPYAGFQPPAAPQAPLYDSEGW